MKRGQSAAFICSIILAVVSISFATAGQVAAAEKGKEMEKTPVLEELKALTGKENTRVLTVAQAEALYMVEMEKDGKKVKIPFGYLNDQWEDLKAKMLKGDTLVEFVSCEESWQDLAGRAGIRLVRNKVILEQIVTRMN
jgi:hypothetical protein